MDMRAFGGGLSGSQIDMISFVKKPSVILRMISIIFSLIVLGCIASGGYEFDTCLFNGSGACAYGIGVSTIAFIAAIAMLIADLLFEKISNTQHRKYVVMVDLVFSAFWTFLWFVAFCYLTNKWTTTPYIFFNKFVIPPFKYGNCKAAIAFSFFSVGAWAGIVYFAVEHYREGTTGLFASAGDIDRRMPGGDGLESGMHTDAPYNPYTDSPGDLAGGYQAKSVDLSGGEYSSYQDQH